MQIVVPSSFRILVVDDDAVTRTLLHDNLIVHGHDVRSAAGGAEAMDIVERGPVQIVVADWLMPEVSGLDLLRHVRGLDLHRQPHFVMLTANTGQERLVEAFDAGVDDFLAKPFNEVELMARLQAWTRLVSLQDEARRLADELRAANERLVAIASIDDLTGLANRRSAMERLEHCIHLAGRHGHPLACALIDVDHFKGFNDRHGHAAGDAVLRRLADVLQRSTRGGDVACRLAGDEFLVLLPHTSLDEANRWAHRFTAALAETPVRFRHVHLAVTVSIGVAQWSDGMTVAALLESADRALYAAKDAGRDAVALGR